jgi:hypothetical protein
MTKNHPVFVHARKSLPGWGALMPGPFTSGKQEISLQKANAVYTTATQEKISPRFNMEMTRLSCLQHLFHRRVARLVYVDVLMRGAATNAIG